jgi:hypothetical protein
MWRAMTGRTHHPTSPSTGSSPGPSPDPEPGGDRGVYAISVAAEYAEPVARLLDYEPDDDLREAAATLKGGFASEHQGTPATP